MKMSLTQKAQDMLWAPYCSWTRENDHLEDTHWQWVRSKFLPSHEPEHNRHRVLYDLPKWDDSTSIWRYQNISAWWGRPGNSGWFVRIRISFVVVNIHMIFNLLLGQPWIHIVGAIPSSLYQKAKFISRNKLESVMATEDIPVPASIMVPIIDSQQVDAASKYHSFEYTKGQDFLRTKLSRT